MSEFERELERALRRVEAPRGFAERVGAAASEGSTPGGKLVAWPRPMRWMGGALAAGLVLGVGGGEGWRLHQAAQRRAAAERQFETAMRVTNRALEQTREQLNRTGVRLFDE